MSYKFKCSQCDFETNDKLSVEMCEKRHNCTKEGHQQTGYIYDFKVTHTKCECGQNTENYRDSLSEEKQNQLMKDINKLVGMYYRR